MFDKVIMGFKDFLKENYITLIVFIIALFMVTYQLPYCIYIGGGIANINDNLSIEGETKSKGTYNFSYVKEIRATISTLIISKFNSDWDVEPLDNLKITDEETADSIELRSHLYLDNANQNATIAAYTKAGKKITINNTYNEIIYILEESETTLEIGDIITKINDIDLNNVDQITKITSSYEVGDTINLEVINDGKTVARTAKIIKDPDDDTHKIIGIHTLTNYDYDTNPEIKIEFKENESGPSAGLMLALSIYDKLVKEDLTNGLKIAGTGTIKSDGTVGEIGGVKYKLKGAVDAESDIFLVPAGANYKECIKLQKKYKYDIKIIPITTLDDAIKKLKNI